VMMTSDEPRVGDDDLLCKRTEKNRLLFSPRDRSSPVNENGRCRSNRSRSRRVRFRRSELRVCVPRTLARVCPQTFSLSWTSRAAQSDARRHGARPHATAGSCFGGRLDWCRHLPSRCVSSRTVTTARSSHLCPPRAGRVPRPDPSNNATRPSRRPQPLGRCGRRDDVHAALPRRLRDATPRFPLRGRSRSPSPPLESRPAPRSGAKLTAICASHFNRAPPPRSSCSTRRASPWRSSWRRMT